MKVYISPRIEHGSDGIFRTVYGQVQHLRTHGIEIVDRIEEADVCNFHITSPLETPPGMPVVVSNHGVHFTGELTGWGKGSRDLNADVVRSVIQADVVTVPSRWIRRALQRGALVNPLVVHHGIDVMEWQPQLPIGYVLWNKSRVDAACDPSEMNQLAARVPSIPFVSTFGTPTPNVKVTNRVPSEVMKELVEGAAVYLDTARESGGPCFGVLEAMACGIPTLSWNYGGTAEAITHQETGYLAELGNYEDLEHGLQYCFEHRERLGANARQECIDNYQWNTVVEGYIAAYEAALQKTRYPVKVSVIVTAHEVAPYLRECLASVQAQTLTDWEMIVVDDASPDECGIIADDAARLDSRITVIHNPTNLHVSDARNVGIHQSRGQYIMPLDGDDRLPPTALALLSEALDKNSHLQIVTGSLLVFTEDGRDFISGWPPPHVSYFEQIKGHNQLPYGSMYRRKVWENTGGYRRRIRTGVEDADFWARALSFGYRAERITQEPTLWYTMRSNSLGKQKPGDWLSWFSWSKDDTLTPFAATEWMKDGWPVYSYQPKVSVVIPVGPGHAHHIQTCLDSLMAQTEVHWEAIVVNDTGMRWGDHNPYLAGFPFVTFLDSDKNRGVAYARNRGVEAATTDKIVFLDVDDIAQPDMLKVLLGAYEQAKGWIYSDWYYVRETGEAPVLSEAKSFSPTSLLQKSLAPLTGLYAKEDIQAAGGFDEDAPGWEDWAFQLALLEKGICGTRVSYPLITYHMNLGQRREDNFIQRQELIQYIVRKFNSLYSRLNQGDTFMGCCGKGGAQTLTVQKAAGNGSSTPPPMSDSELWVVEYTGSEVQTRRLASRALPGKYYQYSTLKREMLVLPGDLERLRDRADMKVVGPYKEIKPVTVTEQQVVADAAPVSDIFPVPEVVPVPEPEPVGADNLLDVLDRLSLKPEIIGLLKTRYATIPQVQKASDAELLSIKGIGRGRLEIIRKATQEWTHRFGSSS